MPASSHRPAVRVLVVALLLAAVAPCVATAAPSTWTGGGGSGLWGTTSNWGLTPAPSTSGTFSLVFGGTTQTIGTNNVGAVAIGALSFTNSGTLAANQNRFFSITGGTLALQNASITTTAALGGSFTTNSDGDTISSPMTLSGTTSFSLGALHSMSLAGAMSGGGGVAFDNVSSGTMHAYLSGSNSYTGGTLINGCFVQTAVRSTAGASNNSALGSGAVTISDNGTLLVRNASVVTNAIIASGTGMSGSSLVGSFGAASQTAEVRGGVTLAGDTQFSTVSTAASDITSKLMVSGPVDLGANTLSLQSGIRGGLTVGLWIEVSGAVTGAGNIVVNGVGSGSRVLMTAANSYSGLTTVTAGTLALSGSGSIGTGGLNLGTTGSSGVFDLAGLTAGSYSLPATGNLTGVGTLSGSGKSLAVLGSFLPGNSPGTVTVGSGLTLDLSQSGTSVFEITSPAFTAGTFDLVDGTGNVTFGGVLSLVFSGGTYADGFNVDQIFANTGGRSGIFSAVNATGLAPGQSATFDPATGTISIVPEPSACSLAAIAALGMAMIRTARRGTWRGGGDPERTAAAVPPARRRRGASTGRR